MIMKNNLKRGILLLLVLAAAGFLLWIYQLNQIEREPLMETGGREFVKARVLSVIKDNEEAGSYIGNQTVSLELLSGSHKGSTVEALSSSGYLYGVHCREGMTVTLFQNPVEYLLLLSTVFTANLLSMDLWHFFSC